MEVPNEEIKEIKNIIIEMNSKIEQIEQNINVIMNSNNSNKLKLLEDKLKIAKKLDVNAVKKILGCSHPWALELMKKLANSSSFFKFYPGDERLRLPSRIVFLEEIKSKEDLDKIGDFVFQKKDVNIGEIAKHLKYDFEIYEDYIRSLINKLVNEYPEAFRMNGNNHISYSFIKS